jgi:DNA polymerase-1
VTETKKRQKLVLLDAHAIIHRAYHALPQFASSKGEPTGALYGLCAMVLKIAKDLKPDFIIAAYDLPKPTHRHEVYKDYKAGRKKTDEELLVS